MRTSSPYWCYRYLSLMWSVQEGYLPSSFFFLLNSYYGNPIKCQIIQHFGLDICSEKLLDCKNI